MNERQPYENETHENEANESERELTRELAQAIIFLEKQEIKELTQALEDPEFISGELAFLVEKGDHQFSPAVTAKIEKFKTLVNDDLKSKLSEKAKAMLEFILEEISKSGL